LAQRSAEAAKEINSLISASTTEVMRGEQLAQSAKTEMNDIIGTIDRVSQMMAAMNESLTQQASELGQVNRAVIDLDAMTQQNTALVEESAAAAASLRGQSDLLKRTTSRFDLAVA
jgi:methyl-accepting chemotaxis protein